MINRSGKVDKSTDQLIVKIITDKTRPILSHMVLLHVHKLLTQLLFYKHASVCKCTLHTVRELFFRKCVPSVSPEKRIDGDGMQYADQQFPKNPDVPFGKSIVE